MRVSVAYLIANGFDAINRTEIHAAWRPPTRRATNQIAPTAPTMQTAESERTATALVPNTAVHTCSSA